MGKSRFLIKRIVLMMLVSSLVLLTCGCGDDDEYYDDKIGVYDDYDDFDDHRASSVSDVNTSTGNSSGQSITEVTNNASLNAAIREHQVKLKGNGQDKVTVLVYMNGSDLESDDGEATTDLQEMIKAGSSDKVNIIVQTMGTKKWSRDLGIASDRSQIYELNGDGVKLVKDNLGQLDCTVTSTLKNFISFGAENYPADRYILLFWNHGGGPVYGYGYDQFQGENDALTIDEIQAALKGAGVYFDFIGMDCCLMSSMEVCCAFYDYCDYCILAEDFESGYGWEYTTWLKKLYANTSISTEELGKSIVDSMIAANESKGEEGILALIDQKYTKVLYSSWISFAYSNEKDLLGKNFSRHMMRGSYGRVAPVLKNKGFIAGWDYSSSDDDYSLSDYYITDIMAVASNVDSDEAKALASAVSQSLLYVRSTAGDANLTGISVTLPYGDSDFYSELVTVFTNCGIDSNYIEWLGNFVGASGASNYYNYDQWDDDWDGWDDYDDDYDWNFWDWFWADDDFDNDYYGYDDDYDYDDWGWDYWDYDDSYNYYYDDGDDCYYDDWYGDYDYYYDDDDDWWYDDDDYWW